MKRLLLLALLVSLSFAAQSSGIGSALSGLCAMSQSFLGLLAMLLIISAPATAGFGLLVYFFTKGKHKIGELAGKIIIGLGILLAIGAVLSIVIYLITPWLISFLMGGDPIFAADSCALGR